MAAALQRAVQEHVAVPHRDLVHHDQIEVHNVPPVLVLRHQAVLAAVLHLGSE